MSLSTDAYDPLAPEDKPKTGLMTRKDAIRIFGGLLFLAIIGLPVYNKMMEDRNKYVCRSHLGEILKAMQLYAEINTDRFPPAYAIDNDGNPIMSKGRANTWVSVISGMMNKPTTEFSCPTAHDDEHVANAGPSGITLKSTFGLFGAMSAMPTSSVASPTQTALLIESSDRGSQGTLNPIPFGANYPDGFLVGFDNTNLLPGELRSVINKSEYASRLAFRNTKNKSFTKQTAGRHGEVIHIAYVDGHIGNIKAPAAKIQRQGEEIVGLWSVR
jgi:prepilin-type processing-associated H-X9-DG protein